MIANQKTYTLSEFQHNANAHLQRLKASGKPEVLTVNGHAELVVQDATAYHAMLDRLEAIEGIHSGLSTMQQGKGRAVDEFFAEFAEKYQIK